MDTITTLWTAIVSGATAAATQSALEQPIRAAYDRFKTLLMQKVGQAADLLTALRQVEAKPASEPRQALLREELETAVQSTPAALNDPALLAAASQLLSLLAPTGQTISAGERGIAVGGSVNNSQLSTGDNSRNIQADSYIERQEAPVRKVNTGGGTYVEGNLDVGGDFTGRDRTTKP